MTRTLWALGLIAACTIAALLGYHAAGLLPSSP